MEKNIIDAIETKLGYGFKDKALLIQVFTRESYAKEQRVKGLDAQSNEQLEYFGDSVLNYLVLCGQLDNFTKVMDEIGLPVLYKEGKLSEFNSHWTDKTMLSKGIDALAYIYVHRNKKDANPQNKLFKLILNITNPGHEMKVIVIDTINYFVGNGTVYPDNKKADLFVGNDLVKYDDTDDMWKVYEDPEQYLFDWVVYNPNCKHFTIPEVDFRYIIHQEVEKLSKEVKENGVLLRDALEKIAAQYID